MPKLTIRWCYASCVYFLTYRRPIIFRDDDIVDMTSTRMRDLNQKKALILFWYEDLIWGFWLYQTHKLRTANFKCIAFYWNAIASGVSSPPPTQHPERQAPSAKRQAPIPKVTQLFLSDLSIDRPTYHKTLHYCQDNIHFICWKLMIIINNDNNNSNNIVIMKITNTWYLRARRKPKVENQKLKTKSWRVLEIDAWRLALGTQGNWPG